MHGIPDGGITIWVKILFAGKQPMYIGSFYRPTNRDPKPLIELGKAVEKLTSKNRLPNIILCGDFNTPDINWTTYSMMTGHNKPQYGKELNQTLLDLVNDNMLSQMQHAPIRGDNILDLCFTTLPDQIKRVEVVPGISDHEAVTIHLDTANMPGRNQGRCINSERVT